jgi:hypothetical protein
VASPREAGQDGQLQNPFSQLGYFVFHVITKYNVIAPDRRSQLPRQCTKIQSSSRQSERRLSLRSSSSPRSIS